MTAGASQVVNLRSLLEEMIEKDASDLHIVAGERPKLRVDGDIVNSGVEVVLTPKDTLSPSTRSLGRSPATMCRSDASRSIISSSRVRRFTVCEAPAVMPLSPSRLPPGW